ncbi:MAG: hypothetical protein R3B07_11315 [Polyangiaceae bacterium]
MKLAVGLLATLLLLSGCTLHHSKQALVGGEEPPPAPNATFIQEEDSGVSLLGFVEIAEPDHYAVLLERARRRYKCGRIHHVQLDFFTDHWLLIAFPISRITAICDPPQGNTQGASAKR